MVAGFEHFATSILELHYAADGSPKVETAVIRFLQGETPLGALLDNSTSSLQIFTPSGATLAAAKGRPLTWPTHTLFGVSTLWLLAPLPPEILQVDLGVLAAAAAFGALLPDLDASESKIKHLKIPNTQVKPFLLPALVVSRSDQHRGLLPSLAGSG